MKEFAGKRVVILVENLPVPFDRRVWQEALALRDRGAAVSIVCPTGGRYRKRFALIEGIAVYRHPLIEARGAAGYLVEYALALIHETLLCARVFLSHGFDVIQICNPPDLLFLVAAPYKLFARTKVVFDHHDLTPELALAKYAGSSAAKYAGSSAAKYAGSSAAKYAGSSAAKYGKRRFLYRLMVALERRTFRLADHCLATNESYRRIALSRGRKRAGEVTVVRSGPDPDRMRLVAPDPALKRGRRVLVAYVGVIGKQEGLTHLVDACAWLVKERKRTDLHFLVIGDGPERPSIQDYACQKGVDEYFTFPGRLPDDALLTALNTADVCVNPDEYNEMNDKSTMNKILEYMALGKPIVQFDLTEGRVSAGEASLYARPNDAVDLARKLLELADDPEKRRAMGEIGYERIRAGLSWEFQKERLYEAYRKVFGMDEAIG